MPTIKQKAVIKRIVENHGNISKSMAEVGYKPATAKNPKNLTESKGFQQLMNEMGLTDELLNKMLLEDLIDKKGNRLGEMTLLAKLKRKLTDQIEIGDLQVEVVDYEKSQIK